MRRLKMYKLFKTVIKTKRTIIFLVIIIITFDHHLCGFGLIGSCYSIFSCSCFISVFLVLKYISQIDCLKYSTPKSKFALQNVRIFSIFNEKPFWISNGVKWSNFSVIQ